MLIMLLGHAACNAEKLSKWNDQNEEIERTMDIRGREQSDSNQW